jgi:hypothetical protein
METKDDGRLNQYGLSGHGESDQVWYILEAKVCSVFDEEGMSKRDIAICVNYGGSIHLENPKENWIGRKG